MKPEHSCSKRVYSGARWDMPGHMCQIKAAVERDGRWYCRLHDPEKVAAREAERNARWKAEEDAERALLAQSEKLISALGFGSPQVAAFARKYTGGVDLTESEANQLAGELASLRKQVEELEEFQSSIASRMPEEYDGDEAQEYHINRWLDDLTGEVETRRRQLNKAAALLNRRGADL